MKRAVITGIFVLLFTLCLGIFCSAAEVRPDTWAAVDGLERTLVDNDETGDVREGKTVAMFYWSWHYSQAGKGTYIPTNVTQVISQFPNAINNFTHEAWDGAKKYFWDEPVFGFYKTNDKYVLRKHAEMLADAGVDVIVFDCTNNTALFKESYTAIFEVFEQAKEEGINVPKVAFMLGFGDTGTVRDETVTKLTKIYEDIYKPGKYQDLWFYWNKKPFVMAWKSCLDLTDDAQLEMYKFFEFRANEPAYQTVDTVKAVQKWSWCSVYPQAKNGTGIRKVTVDGVSQTITTVEEIAVSVAQNYSRYGLVAMNDYRGGVFGRGYTKGNYSYTYWTKGEEKTVHGNTKDAYLYGTNFQQQWDYAIENDPSLVFVTGWNEWTMGRYETWQNSPNAFPDEFTDEFSRDIEPTKGILKDNFYYQLVNNVRKYKGTSKPVFATVKTNANSTLSIGAGAAQWADIDTEMSHYTGNTRARDNLGYGNIQYTSDTMRNDIVNTKVAYDDEYIYFMVETKDALTPSTDNAWMRLFLDTDSSDLNGNWEGFEFVVNRISPEGDKAIVEASTGGWNFTEVARADFSVKDNMLEIAVPRAALGLAGTKVPVFNYKWADNTIADDATKDSGDILDFYRYGDVAPGGRFAFVFHAIKPGDVNEDGKITSVDYLKIRQTFSAKTTLNNAEFAAADYNCDGRILSVDYLSVKKVFSGK